MPCCFHKDPFHTFWKASVELLNVIHWLYGYASSSFVIISCKTVFTYRKRNLSPLAVFLFCFFNIMMCNDSHLKRGLNLTSVEYVLWSCQPWKVTLNITCYDIKQSWSVFLTIFFSINFWWILRANDKNISADFLPTKQLNSRCCTELSPINNLECHKLWVNNSRNFSK